MKIFGSFETDSRQMEKRSGIAKSGRPQSVNKQGRGYIRNSAVKLDLSPSEIREKVKNYEIKKNELKIQNNVTFEKPVSDEEMMTEEKKMPESTLLNNHPSNTNTTEKLKEALKLGTLNFSDKTKQVLGEILKERSS